MMAMRYNNQESLRKTQKETNDTHLNKNQIKGEIIITSKEEEAKSEGREENTREDEKKSAPKEPVP